MKVTASAPGKAILFGEHAVVYGKPAIAMAVNRKAIVTIQEGTNDHISIKIPKLDVYGAINLENHRINPLKTSTTQDQFIGYPKNSNYLESGINHSNSDKHESLGSHSKSDNLTSTSSPNDMGILQFIRNAIFNCQFQPDHGLDVKVDLEIPIGAGLGSSAAITVATIAALARYLQEDLTTEQIARMAHQVELDVQGAASPLDTTISTQGGFIYFSRKKGAMKIKPALEMPMVVGYTPQPGNTGKLVAGVRKLHDNHPEIIKPILDTIEKIVNQAREAIINGNQEKIGQLMNINQGLLDALGVNTNQLSNLVYQARSAGATGSKLTGAGGGGSIIAYCPGKTQEVLERLEKVENAFQVNISHQGVTWK
jgi:mevalonate kinase